MATKSNKKTEKSAKAAKPDADSPSAGKKSPPTKEGKSTPTKAKASSKASKTTSSRSQAAAVARSKKAAHIIQRDWLARKNSSQQESASPYSMKTAYELNTVIEHPRFGTGFVTAVMPHKIQVTFEDQVLFLVHAREAL